MIEVLLNTTLTEPFSHIEGDCLWTERLNYEILRYLALASTEGACLRFRETSDEVSENGLLETALDALSGYFQSYLEEPESPPAVPNVGSIVPVGVGSSVAGLVIRIALILLEQWIRARIGAGKPPTTDVNLDDTNEALTAIHDKLEELRVKLHEGLIYGEEGGTTWPLIESLGLIIPNINIDTKSSEMSIAHEFPTHTRTI